MRDIRDDLEDRVKLLRELINAAQAQFERHLEQIKREHDGRLGGLKADLDAVTLLLGVEDRRLGSAPPAPKAQPQSRQPQSPPVPPRQAQPRPRLADFLIRKLGDGRAMSRDELCQLAMKEGYFAGSDSAEPALSEALTQILKAGFIRHLPDGKFAAPSVTDTIRLRRGV
jgi:hypothetical protein